LRSGGETGDDFSGVGLLVAQEQFNIDIAEDYIAWEFWNLNAKQKCIVINQS
jgi:hypothetical protein